MVQITQKGESAKGNKDDRKNENYKKGVMRKKTINPFKLGGQVSWICPRRTADSISRAWVEDKSFMWGPELPLTPEPSRLAQLSRAFQEASRKPGTTLGSNYLCWHSNC